MKMKPTPYDTSGDAGQPPWMTAWMTALLLALTGFGGAPGVRADTLAVSGPMDNKIYYVAPDGTASPIATINYYPEGVVFGPDSTTLYVANYGGSLINRVSSSGAVSTFVTGLTGPYGLAFDSKTNLFVACYDVNRVKKVSPAKVVTDFATISGAYGLAVDAADNLYVAGLASRLYRIAPDGASSPFGPALAGTPRGVAVDASGWVFVATTGGTITRISPSGAGSLLASGLSGPVGLAFDSVGNLYAANLNNRTVSKIDTNGVVTTFATVAGGAKWIAAYPGRKFSPGSLSITRSADAAVLTWVGNFTLQSSTEVGGSYLDMPAATSPCTNSLAEEAPMFFRLRN